MLAVPLIRQESAWILHTAYLCTIVCVSSITLVKCRISSENLWWIFNVDIEPRRATDEIKYCCVSNSKSKQCTRIGTHGKSCPIIMTSRFFDFRRQEKGDDKKCYSSKQRSCVLFEKWKIVFGLLINVGSTKLIAPNISNLSLCLANYLDSMAMCCSKP